MVRRVSHETTISPRASLMRAVDFCATPIQGHCLTNSSSLKLIINVAGLGLVLE